MGNAYEIGLCGELPDTLLRECAGNLNFTACPVEHLAAFLSDEDIRADAILLTFDTATREQLDTLLTVLEENQGDDAPPFLVRVDSPEVGTKVTLLNAGADDVIDPSDDAAELVGRVQKAVTHHIATRQLRSQLQLANEVAMSAMTDTGDYGNNIQFLLDSSDCDNFDQLGQRLFQALDYYGLNCSLQIRGRFEQKNMERTGLARELESQLLSHFALGDRFHQSGKRLFCNFEQVSILIKNMPVEDEVRCGKIRDNIFSLLQGTDARVKALDDRQSAQQEMLVQSLLTEHMEKVLHQIESTFDEITNEIVTATEQANDQIYSALNHLGLSEQQEQTIVSIMEQLIKASNDSFNRGLRENQAQQKLFAEVSALMSVPMDERADALEKLQKLI